MIFLSFADKKEWWGYFVKMEMVKYGQLKMTRF